MKTTAALYVRQLLAKLHPPLPQTARKSKQFLTLLETSFRKHLDEAHPPPDHRGPPEPSHRDVPLASTQSSSHATRRYFESLLTHPMLDKPADGLQPRTRTRHAIQRYQKAYAEGTLTADFLASCVKEYCAGLRDQEQVEPGVRFGPHLASYVFSASPDDKAAFFGSDLMLSSALQIMSKEGDEATVWQWLKIVYERDFGVQDASVKNLSHPRWLQAEDSLVSALMRFSIRRRDLNDAGQQFVEACRYRVSSGRAAVSPGGKSPELPLVALLNSWKRLAAAIILARKRHDISTPLFDRILQCGPGWSLVPYLSEPFLSVYHPSAPSAQILCMTLRDAGSAASLISGLSRTAPTMTRLIFVSLLDSAQLSLDQGLEQDARFLLDFAAIHFSEYLPPQAVPSATDVRERIAFILQDLRQQVEVEQEMTLECQARAVRTAEQCLPEEVARPAAQSQNVQQQRGEAVFEEAVQGEVAGRLIRDLMFDSLGSSRRPR